jgi:hypothetical protein
METVNFREVVPKLRWGTVLWRNFHTAGRRDRAIVEDVEFKPQPRGGFAARLLLPGCGCEPQIWTPIDQRTTGVVLFTKEQPPDGWKYLVLEGISKAGNAVFAHYESHDISDTDYACWCDDCYQFIKQTENLPAEKRLSQYLELSFDLRVAGPRPRLVIFPSGTGVDIEYLDGQWKNDQNGGVSLSDTEDAIAGLNFDEVRKFAAQLVYAVEQHDLEEAEQIIHTWLDEE